MTGVEKFRHKTTTVLGPGTRELPYMIDNPGFQEAREDGVEAVLTKLREQENGKGVFLKYPTGSKYMFLHLKKRISQNGSDFHSYTKDNQTILNKDLQIVFEILGIGSPDGFDQMVLKEPQVYKEAIELFVILENRAAEVFK